MRTKILLSLAALAAAGVATSMAEVYSVNAVGYVNVTVPAGPNSWAIIANPLNAASNQLKDLMPSVPAGTTLYFYAGTGFEAPAVFEEQDDGSFAWNKPTKVMAPGEGVFIKNPGATELKITFVGEVMQGTGANKLVTEIPAGFSLRASKVPQSGQLDTVLGYTPGVGDTIYLFKANQQYDTPSKWEEQDDGSFNWSKAPVPAVGQGFWIMNAGAAKQWNREFSVN